MGGVGSGVKMSIIVMTVNNINDCQIDYLTRPMN